MYSAIVTNDTDQKCIFQKLQRLPECYIMEHGRNIPADNVS